MRMRRTQISPSEPPRRARRRRPRRERRGVALILVIGAVAILTLFLTELQEQTSAELSAALADRDALKAEYHARSAVNLGRLVIATEPTVRNALLPMFLMMGMRDAPQIPVWNFSDMLLGPFNDATGAAAFAAVAGVDPASGKNLGLPGGGRFEVKIVDEESKINVNGAARGAAAVMDQNRLAQQLLALFNQEQYRPLFEQRDADNQFSDAVTICGALIDWADDDEMLNACNPDPNAVGGATGGVEDNFYQLIGQTYQRKNAAFDSLEEVRMVRGFGDDLWATFVDPDPGNPDKRVITVWGRPQATINVNNAPPTTLLAVICAYADPVATPLCTDPAQMSTFIMGVTMARGLLQGAPLFGGSKDFTSAITGTGQGGGIGAMVLQAMGLQPVVLRAGGQRDLQAAVSTTSKFFSIYGEGVVPGNKRETRVRIHAVIDTSGATAVSEIGLNAVVPTSGAGQIGDAMSPAAYEGMVRINPAGNIVYWRIE
ncbi:MAG TPA: hypothetical protein VLS89_21365 [Candidatus Nanopelagicales bacterium]|nr:hypothetical protein [Candidatus Nanopelagicales bacterium]